ncbi:MAG: RusA family crossover junction endodeoxyribonuclease [Thermoguttaceae bacterium]|nr:RusA family crossover junction endodeoxyribonuclease [Thermoguttaceae bacterium]
MKLFLPIAPPSANRIWRTGRGVTFLSADALAYYKEAKLTWNERVDDAAVSVRIWIIPVRRGIDCDNRIKPVLDAITKANVWEDDSIVADVSIKLVKPDKKKYPRGATFVEILPVAEKYGDGKELEEWKK